MTLIIFCSLPGRSFLLIAVIVKLDSPGPVFYRRRVLGDVRTGSLMRIKFRTMYTNGDELLKDKPELMQQLQTDHKLKDDPRVTRIGRWLRKYSLDELPTAFQRAPGTNEPGRARA